MSLLLLHLSDLHIGDGENPALTRIDQIVGAVQAECLGSNAILVLVTGDVIDRGNVKCYEAAESFFRNLERELRAMKSGVQIVTAIIPGNHDLKLLPEDQGRTQIVRAIQTSPSLLNSADESLLIPCVAAQDEFFSFMERRTGTVISSPAGRLYYELNQVLAGTNIRIRCVNSSWLSTVDEERGTLLVRIPPNESLSPDRLTVTLMHHPYAWLQTENAREVRQNLEHSSDIILTGHEHAADAYSKRTIRSEVNEYIEGSALQDEYNETDSGFNILVAEPADGLVRTSIYSWNGAYYSRTHNGEWVSLERSITRLTIPFQNTTQFIDFLNDPGANFYHPAKEKLTLSDFFIYPDCKDSSYKHLKNIETPIDISGMDLVAKVISNKKTLFVGTEKSGRSALIRKLYIDLQAEAYLPILLRIPTSFRLRASSLERLVEQAVREQYGEQNLEQIKQFPSDRRALLLDDLHSARLNREGVNELIAQSQEFAGISVFTANAIFPLHDFFEDSPEKPSLLNFKHYYIQRFGRLLRSRLVRRWISIGREQVLSSQDLSHRARQTEQLLDTLLRKGIVPSFPFYILTLVQASEANQTLSTETGSFGYHYEFLIVGSVGTAIRSVMGSDRSITQDMVHTFLSNLAYNTFRNRSQEFATESVTEAVVDYRIKYKLQFSIEKFIEILYMARMLRTLPCERTAYSYPYIYYFFAAKYFQRYLTSSRLESELRENLCNITKKLHIDEYAYIVLFLIYLCKDEKTIEMILEQARGLFRGELPCDLEVDVTWMGSNFDIRKELQLGDSKPNENRERILARLDSAGADETNEVIASEAETEEGEVGDLRKLIIAIRHIQIVGQVIRSFPGTLEGETKDLIAQECAMLGFRTMGFILRAIGNGREDFTHEVVEMFKREGIPATQERIQSSVDDFLTYVGILHSYGMIASISTAMGSQHLTKTYDSMGDERAALPFELLKLKLALDHQRSFPADQIVKKHSELTDKSKKVVAASILRLMVWEHLHLFDVDYNDRQRVVAKLDLESSKTQALNPRERRAKR